MPTIQKTQVKPSIKDIRLSGKEVDLQYLYTTHIDRVLSLGSRDLFNDVTAFNTYEGAVENLLSTLVPTADIAFNLDLAASNEFPLETLWDKVSKVRDRFSICIKFMGRRGFWAAGDVETEPLVLLDYIRNRVSKKLDALIGVEGDRGSGKSYTVLWLASKLDKTFSLKRVFFEGEDFRRMLDKEDYPHGSVFVWDEATAGRGLNRRRAMSNENVEFNNILQVIRKRRYIVFFTMPSIERVDEPSLEFFGGKITPVAIDEKNNLCYIKFYQREGTGKRIRWTFIRTPTNHRVTSIPIPNIELEKPDIVKNYEILKDEFLNSIIKRKRKYKKGKKIPDIVSFSKNIKLEDVITKRGSIKLATIQNKYLKEHGEHLGRGYAEQIKEMLLHGNQKEKLDKPVSKRKSRKMGQKVESSRESETKQEAKLDSSDS